MYVLLIKGRGKKGNQGLTIDGIKSAKNWCLSFTSNTNFFKQSFFIFLVDQDSKNSL